MHNKHLISCYLCHWNDCVELCVLLDDEPGVRSNTCCLIFEVTVCGDGICMFGFLQIHKFIFNDIGDDCICVSVLFFFL